MAERRANAARALKKMTGNGRVISPVQIEGRKIATTFWGKAWCDNLESYSDFSNRLPRGRTYVRNGSVVDLQVSEGKVTALVSGSEMYKIEINIKSLSKTLWQRVQSACAGKVDSLIELLQGRLSASVMNIVAGRDHGLFPKPAEISMKCSCPDWAGMCKHLAASLYGIGARLDQKPELLFLLRAVDPSELIGKASADEMIRQTAPVDGQAAIAEADLSGVFGIELAAATSTPPANARGPEPAPSKKNRAVAISAKANGAKRRPTTAKLKKPAERARHQLAASEVDKLPSQPPSGKQSPRQAGVIIRRALRNVPRK